MSISNAEGAAASTPSAGPTPAQVAVQPVSLPCPPTRHSEQIRHLLFGTPSTVQAAIRLLHRLGYADPNDWSRPISTGRAHEVMAILTKRVGG